MRKLLEDFFQHYLAERNLEATLALMTECVVSIGIGEYEVAKGKAEFRNLLESEFTKLPDPLEYKLFDYTEMAAEEQVRNLYANFQIIKEQEHSMVKTLSRLTCTCVKTKHGWKISCLHMSVPAKNREENFFSIDEDRKSENLLSEQEEKLLGLLEETLPGGIMGSYLEEGFPFYMINRKMLELLGYSYEELAAATNQKKLNLIYPDDRMEAEKEIKEQLEEKYEYEVEYRLMGKEERLIWVSDIGRKITAEDGRKAMLSILNDISDRVERESKLKEEAEHDSLTRLYNRKKAISLIEAEFAESCNGTLFICDIDNFKSINDTRGHAVGDKVLCQLADIIQEQAGKATVSARFGGDEYILFFPERVGKNEAIRIMDKIQKEFFDYMKGLAPTLRVSLSVGGTERTEGENIHILYDKADQALYQAKENKGELKFC